MQTVTTSLDLGYLELARHGDGVEDLGDDELPPAVGVGQVDVGLGTDRVNPRAGRASKIVSLHLQFFYGPKTHRIEFGLDCSVKELGCRHARVDDQGSARVS